MRVSSLSHPTQRIQGTAQLPSSKSISNRALILNKVLNATRVPENLSTADDTLIMQTALRQSSGSVDLKNAGTCMRFLTAYYAALPGSDITLRCDERMEKRPIHELVDTLIALGADITYLHQTGFPPLYIKGKKLEGGHINVSATSSSQFTSALMMIAPLCTTGLEIEIRGEVTSKPYIEMTAQLMRQYGIEVYAQDHLISIPAESQAPSLHAQTGPLLRIEPDWSAASYWYLIAALSKEAEIYLPGLSLQSIQGDAAIAGYMQFFQVETIQMPDGILLRKLKTTTSSISETVAIHLADQPDLAPTLAVVAAATNTKVHLTGLQNLAIKESNRLLALETELSRLGAHITATGDSLLIERSATGLKPSSFPVHTYNDHRMAMAFAPLALLFGSIMILHPEVVEKSYPHFWEDLKQQGFIISSSPDIQ